LGIGVWSFVRGSHSLRIHKRFTPLLRRWAMEFSSGKSYDYSRAVQPFARAARRLYWRFRRRGRRRELAATRPVRPLRTFMKRRTIIYGLGFALVGGAYIVSLPWYGHSGPHRISGQARVEALVFAFSTAASGACLTSVFCRRALVHRRQPGWRFVIPGTAITMMLTMIYFSGST